jgi:hypothetical protein
MTFTSYPFDGQDTTEDQYGLLFRELQDNGVTGSFGSTALAVSANSSAMNVTMQPGAAIVRGHMFNSDAVANFTVAASPASGTRYDALILRLDPANNTIQPVLVNNAGATPALTQTLTAIYEILIAVVAVPSGTVTVAASQVTDKRHFISSRIRPHASTNRTTNTRAYNVGLLTDEGGRLEHYDPASTSWVSRMSNYWGTGTVLPTVGLRPGDTFLHSGLGLMRYNGTAWRQADPMLEVPTSAARLALATNYPAALHSGFQVLCVDTQTVWNYSTSGVAPYGSGWVMGNFVGDIQTNGYVANYKAADFTLTNGTQQNIVGYTAQRAPLDNFVTVNASGVFTVNVRGRMTIMVQATSDGTGNGRVDLDLRTPGARVGTDGFLNTFSQRRGTDQIRQSITWTGSVRESNGFWLSVYQYSGASVNYTAPTVYVEMH